MIPPSGPVDTEPLLRTIVFSHGPQYRDSPALRMTEALWYLGPRVGEVHDKPIGQENWLKTAAKYVKQHVRK